jgi:hypothetical protein
VPGLFLLCNIHELGLVLLPCHVGTTSNSFDGVCRTLYLDVNVDLQILYIKLMETLKSTVYFRLWVTKWVAQDLCSTIN